MNRLGWLLFDVALVVARYRRVGQRRAGRDYDWSRYLRAMATRGQHRGVWA